jgi:hypothetical protein
LFALPPLQDTRQQAPEAGLDFLLWPLLTALGFEVELAQLLAQVVFFLAQRRRQIERHRLQPAGLRQDHAQTPHCQDPRLRLTQTRQVSRNRARPFDERV